jgi:capsular exopolysaccharide synthesis family protein
MFNVPLSPGLSDVLAGDAKPSEALLESHVSGLFILPGGTSKAANTELLDSERLTHLIRGFSQVFDLVLLDCPPVMAVADASIIANAASGVVFVVGSGVTSREAAQAAVDRLTSVQARVVGVILNKAKSDRPGYANPYYYQTQDIA